MHIAKGADLAKMFLHAIISLMLCMLPWAAAANHPCVVNGATNATCFGWNASDGTAFLQAALDAQGAGLVYIDCPRVAVATGTMPTTARPPPCTWILRPIFIRRSKVRVILQQGITLLAKRGEYHPKGDKLFKVEGVTDIVIEGGQQGLPAEEWPELRMWRSDYAQPTLYNKSEWRHGLALEDVQRVRVARLRIVETGGDGIYLAGDNNDVHIQDVVLDRNYRQGMSLIGGNNILVERAMLSNTNGTNPMVRTRPSYAA